MSFMPTENAGTMRAEVRDLRRYLDHLPKCSSYRPQLEQRLADAERALAQEEKTPATNGRRAFVTMSSTGESEIEIEAAPAPAPKPKAAPPTRADRATAQFAEPTPYFDEPEPTEKAAVAASAAPRTPTSASGGLYALPTPYWKP